MNNHLTPPPEEAAMSSAEITSERLTLAPLSLSDSEPFFAYRSDPEVALYQGFHPAHIAEAQDFIIRNKAPFNTEDSWFQLGIYREGRLIGDIGIHFIGPDNSQCELGYTLAREEQGKGYASEAVRAVAGYLFGTLKKHRITASLDPRNKASVKLLERIGFRREGCFLKSYWNNGVWEDDLIYALLDEEWIGQ